MAVFRRWESNPQHPAFILRIVGGSNSYLHRDRVPCSRYTTPSIEHTVGVEPTYRLLQSRAWATSAMSALRAGDRDRTGSVPVWKTGAPPLMRHLQMYSRMGSNHRLPLCRRGTRSSELLEHFCGHAWSRTTDAQIFSLPLYHLSYKSKCCGPGI